MTAVSSPTSAVKKTDGTGGAAVRPRRVSTQSCLQPKNGAKTSTAHQVVATDTLPAGLTYVSAAPSRCDGRSQAGSHLVLPNVAPGATQTITLKAVTPTRSSGRRPSSTPRRHRASLDATSPGARTSANLPVGTITGTASSNDTVTAAGAAVTKTPLPPRDRGCDTPTPSPPRCRQHSFPNLVGVTRCPTA